MKIEYYSCDLCKEQIKESIKLKCMYWDCTRQTTASQKFGCYVLIDDLSKSNKHICNSCIQVINDIKKQL